MIRTPEETERRRTWSGEDYPMDIYTDDEEEGKQNER